MRQKNWLHAVQDELKFLNDTNTWTLVERPKNQKNVFPAKRVYKVETRASGSLEKYRDRYIAKVFKGIECVNYFESFAPRSRPEIFTSILSLAKKDLR